MQSSALFSDNGMAKHAPTQQSATSNFDMIIVGGGMVGASLAVALQPLASAGLNVCLLDAFAPTAADQPSYDDRAIALSYGSSLIFKGMGMWQQLAPKTSPINSIHVSDRGHFGATRLSAAQEKVPALGYLVESKVLGQQLYAVLENSAITLKMPAQVIRTEQHNEQAIALTVEQNGAQQTLNTRLLVAADGSNSQIRELAGIHATTSDYQQSAIIANVSTQKPHNGQAFERFTQDGPIALLPMSGNRSSLVWTHSTKNGSAACEAIMALNDADFLRELGKAFGYRLGHFTKVGKRALYPLSLVSAEKNTAYRTVIIGNASHTLHPVAGQGLNLALRDVAVLADLIAQWQWMSTNKQGEKVQKGGGVPITNASNSTIADLLANYEQIRAGDLKTTIRYTDSLVRVFSNDSALLGHARAGGLLAVDRIEPLRNWLTNQSMGIHYRQARLARGLALRVAG